MVIHYLLESPVGPLSISCSESEILSLRIASDSLQKKQQSVLGNHAVSQLQEYFAGTRAEFDLPIRLEGTPFQQAVWKELMKIPYGQTRTYGQIAAAIGKPKATRAVGSACNRNPIWIIVPCHRVVGSNRNLTGYAGGLSMKQALLDLEQSHK